MKTAAKTPMPATSTAVAGMGPKGKAMPAVPVLQQKPVQPVTGLKTQDASENQTSYTLNVAPAVQRQTPANVPSTVISGSQPVQMNSGPGDASQVVQMVKASELVKIGRQWNSEIWVKADSSRKAEMIRQIETATGFKSGTVFQAYDLYIRGAGPSAYKDIVKTLGKKDAETFLSFLNDEVEFENLGGILPKLAVIVCVSETGRGYSVGEMKDFMEEIISGETTWTGIKESYAPSLTYKEDAYGKEGEYRADMDEAEDHVEEMTEADEEPISEDEAAEMRKEAEASGQGGVTRLGTAFH